MTRLTATAMPRLSDDHLRELAAHEGVCVRPLISKVTDTVTGEARTVIMPCGSTRAAACPTCADKARRLRIQQCREGWHLDVDPPKPTRNAGSADEDQALEDDDAARRVRSTRRRQDAPNLPNLPVDDRTVGHTYAGNDGQTYRPSMFLTLTLPSYGAVHTASERNGKAARCACGRTHKANSGIAGTPIDPATYDYRRAALDALHFPKLVDRFWQNLRRATGYSVQYFATVEPQKRLAAHLHAAIRGAIPRALLRQVVEATYHQVWWPEHDKPVYTDVLPVWDELAGGHVDPSTGAMLPTWDQALDQIDADPEARPAHVIRFGSQVDMQGILAGTKAADRRVGYLTKYLVKDISEDITDNQDDAARRAHVDRLAAEVRWLPCSPTCANWLRYGVQPKNPREGLVPGFCRSKAHDRHHLGLGGRRVLVSRRWTGKTLTEHKADCAAVVREVLAAAGVQIDDHDELSATATRPDGQPRFVWSPVNPGDPEGPSYLHLIAAAIRQRHRWREQYEAAKTAIGPPADLSATHPEPAAHAA